METKGRITVLLVDDHDGVRGLLKDYLNDQPGIQVVADTKDGRTGVKLAWEVAPTVAVVDISMRDPDGVTVCRNITASGQGVKVVALTWHSDRSFVPQMLAAGASGYVLKRSASTELVAAIRAVAAGEVYVDGAVRVTPPGPSQRSAPAVLPDGMLDAKEVHVLRLVAEGRSNLEIAKELESTTEDVARLKAAAMAKAGLTSRAKVVQYAERQVGSAANLLSG